jgi:hypothetical protein
VLAPRGATHLQGTIGYAEPARSVTQIAILFLYGDAGRGIGGGLTDFLQPDAQ